MRPKTKRLSTRIATLKTPRTFGRTFGRAQLAAAIATALDYAALIGLVEVAHVGYVTATALGAAVGAVSNFTINRYWSFEGAELASWQAQALRYALVSIGSLLLNTLGVYLLTDTWGLHYSVSKVVTSLSVALFFNYPLHRRFVFR